MKKIFPIAKPAASACLCGHKVRYDGGDCAAQNALPERILPVCPEVMGGLPTPRAPAEIVGGDGHDVWAGRACVLDAHGVDVTEAFKQGAELALQRLQAACLCSFPSNALQNYKLMTHMPCCLNKAVLTPSPSRNCPLKLPS